MKKILTFLVMLFATVSILSAQTAKFNYQAVVRDAKNQHNLVMNTPCTLTVEIKCADTVTYKEVIPGETNRNGMFACIIGNTTTPEKGTLEQVDWSNALITSYFTVDNDTVSVVDNPIMAVPFALQAKAAPLAITTNAICQYLLSPEVVRADADAILAALIANADLNQYVKDTIVGYIKANPQTVKDVVLYYLHNELKPQDLDDARDTITTEVKNKMNELFFDYLKNHKAQAFKVMMDYLDQTTLDDVKDIWHAVRSNPNFDTLFKMTQDSIIKYIENHDEILVDLAQHYISNATPEQVNKVYNYLKTNKPAAYNFLLNKFQNYLHYYLEDVYYAVSDSCTKPSGERINICDLQKQVQQIIDTDCDAFTISSFQYTAGAYHLTATFKDVPDVNTNEIEVYYMTSANADWIQATTGNDVLGFNGPTAGSNNNTTVDISIAVGTAAPAKVKVVWRELCTKITPEN